MESRNSGCRRRGFQERVPLRPLEGNLISRIDSGTQTVLFFTWDYRNRLVGIREADYSDDTYFELTYEYDVFNRRIARTHYITTTIDGGEGHEEEEETFTTITAERFVYDGDHVALDFYRPNGGSYSLAHRYLYGPVIDQVLAQENVAPNGTAVSISSPNRVYWMLADNLGTVRDLLDAEGAAKEHYVYGAFGQVLDGDTSLTRYLYTAREFDSVTGLQYNRMRWYDSGTGRWLSEDPTGFAGDRSNLYRYVGNGVTYAMDPTGLKRVLETAVAKSYINTITNVGTMPTPDSTALLWAFAQGTNVFENDGQVTTPAKDGRYRLFVQLNISLDVNSDGISNLNVTHTEEGGKEATGIYGTVNVLVDEERVSNSIRKVRWLTWGRPNAALEWTFQSVWPRTSKNIWHQGTVTIYGCGDSAEFSVEEFVGSDFPSHRVWVGAGLEGDLPQGALSSLWRSDTIKGPAWVTRDGTGPFVDVQRV